MSITRRQITTIAICGAILATIAIPIIDRVRWFMIEDDIHGTHFPIARAIYDFQTDNSNKPPATLEELIPTYLPSIPTNHLVSSTEYITQDYEWAIVVTSDARGTKREYWQTSETFRIPEDILDRIVKQFHLWKVIEDS